MRASDAVLLPRRFPGGVVRRLRAADLDAFQAYRRIPELGRFQGWSAMTDAEAAAFLEEMSVAPLVRPGEWLQLGIATADTDRLVGDLGLHVSADAESAEIGYTLAPQWQGRGLATAAVREAVLLLFAATPVARIVGVTDARNLPSARLLERVGFACRETRVAEFRGEVFTERIYVLERGDVR